MRDERKKAGDEEARGVEKEEVDQKNSVSLPNNGEEEN